MRDRPVISQLEDDRELLDAPLARPPTREPLRRGLGATQGALAAKLVAFPDTGNLPG